MKKIILITLTVFLNLALFSCSNDDDHESFYEEAPIEYNTGDEDEYILPDEDEDDGDGNP